MSFYSTGLTVGAPIPSDSSLDELRKWAGQALEDTDPNKKFVIVSFGVNSGQEVFENNDESQSDKRYDAQSNDNDIYFIAYYKDRKLFKTYIGDVLVKTPLPKKNYWPWVIGAGAGVLGLMILKKR